MIHVVGLYLTQLKDKLLKEIQNITISEDVDLTAETSILVIRYDLNRKYDIKKQQLLLKKFFTYYRYEKAEDMGDIHLFLGTRLKDIKPILSNN